MIVLHDKTDFDVDFFPNWANVLENLLSLYACLPNGSIYWLFEITFKSRSYPTNIDEGTTIVIMSGMNFGSFKSCSLDTPGNPL